MAPSYALRRSLRPLSFWLLLLLPLLCVAQDPQLCDDPVAECNPDKNYFTERLKIDYANSTLAKLKFSNTFVDFEVRDPFPNEGQKIMEWQYRLVKCGCPKPDDTPDSTTVLFTKPSSVYVSESPPLSLLDSILPDLEWLTYTGDVKNIYNQEVVNRIVAEKATAIPSDKGFSAIKEDDTVSLSIIGHYNIESYEEANTGKPYLIIGEVNEANPLGRAEWMKILGLLFDAPADANKLFTTVEERYLKAKEFASRAQRRPSVFFNNPYGSNYKEGQKPDENFVWFQPGPNQYISAMVKDANAEYRLDDGGAIESYSLKFSEITGNFSSATYLIHTSTNPVTDDKTLQQFIEDPVGPESAGDDSFKKLSKGLASVRCGNVWSHSKAIRGSASDFFESQVFHPDKYLSELVHIFHPYLKTKKDEDLIWSYSLGEAPEQVVGSKCPFTNLAGDPPEGRQYVDHEFKVSSLTRFEIEDKTESEILPKLRSATDLDGNFVELFFKSARATSGEDTKFTVRLAVKKEDAEDFESSDPMLKALRESMGEDVALVDGEEEESDSGGIGGWGIAAIVVSIVVLIAVVGFCALSRRRKRGAAPANGNWASAEAVGGSDEYVPMTAV